MAISTTRRSRSSSSSIVSSSSSSFRSASSASTSNVRASAYAGIPSPPPSPPLAANSAASATAHKQRHGKPARRGGAAYTITGECERLFCETLRAVFLGEGRLRGQDSLVLGTHSLNNASETAVTASDYGVAVAVDENEDEGDGGERSKVTEWIEMWDYVGGVRFRGFVIERASERAMFVFFDQSVVSGDLKAGLMALLELCDLPYFSCERLVVCVDRLAPQLPRDTLVKDLGWIGFGLTTLEDFTDEGDIMSEKWLFMDMET